MPVSTTITREHAAFRASAVDVDKYQLHIDVTSATEFTVETTVKFTASSNLKGRPVSIDLLGHKVSAAYLNGQPITYQGSHFVLDDLRDHNELTVTSSAPYSTTGEGLHRYVDPTDNAIYLYSQCEPADARRIFPVFEQPDLKAIFELTVKAPKHWVVISNEPGESTLQQHHAEWKFAPTRVMSSYLFALIAGEYVEVAHDTWSSENRAVPLGLWARKSLAKYVDAQEILQVTKAGFEFFEKEFGVPYPFTKYDQIFVPEFNAGAMENVGAVTITEDYIFRSPVSQAVTERRAITVLHELAHMWFGNLVTMRWWDDLWLNESFAEFVSHLAAPAAGYPEAWTTFNTTEKTWAYRQDQLSTTHPVVADMVDLDAVAVNFDGITYAKGAAVLRQLVAWVGQEEFMEAIRQYFVEFAWQNTTFSDLLLHLETASGRDLSTWSQQWLQSTGPNTLSWTRKDNQLIIHQSAPVRQHKVGVGYYNFVNHQLTRTAYEEVDINTETTAFEVQPAELILVNDQDLTYATLRPDDVSTQTYTQHLSDIDDSLARSLIWGSAWEQTRVGQTSARSFLALVLQHLATETHSSIVFTLLRQVSLALRNFVPDNARDQARLKVATNLWDIIHQVPPNSDLQLQLIQAFLEHARENHVEHVTKLAARKGPAGFTVSQDMAWSALQRLVAMDHADQTQITKALKQDGTTLGQLAALRSQAMIPTPQAKARAWESIIGGNVSNQELRYLILGFTDAHNLALLEPYVEQYFEHIESLWSKHSFEMAETLAVGLYPGWSVTQETAQRSSKLSESTHHTALQRILWEQHDDLQLALRARSAFDSHNGFSPSS